MKIRITQTIIEFDFPDPPEKPNSEPLTEEEHGDQD